jgi:sugar-specific transcriptional regulator TrmB
LTSLGLSTLEAKVYLVLLKTGESSAKGIAKTSKVSQPDVYRVLSGLEKHGLVERIIALPNKFKATPIDEGITILLQRRDAQSALLHKQTKQLVESLKEKKQVNNVQEEHTQFTLVPGAHVQKIKNAVDNAQSLVLCFTNLDMFKKIRFVTEEVWKRGVKRQVNYQFIIGKPNEGPVTLELDPTLKNNDFFNFKFMVASMPCVILIDKKEIFIRTELNLEAPVLWSNNQRLVAMMQDYFMLSWQILENQASTK